MYFLLLLKNETICRTVQKVFSCIQILNGLREIGVEGAARREATRGEEWRGIGEGEGELFWRSGVLGSLERKPNGHLSHLGRQHLGTGDQVSTFLLPASQGY